MRQWEGKKRDKEWENERMREPEGEREREREGGRMSQWESERDILSEWDWMYGLKREREKSHYDAHDRKNKTILRHCKK